MARGWLDEQIDWPKELEPFFTAMALTIGDPYAACLVTREAQEFRRAYYAFSKELSPYNTMLPGDAMEAIRMYYAWYAAEEARKCAVKM